MGRHEATIEPTIGRSNLSRIPLDCSHPVSDMEWRRDERVCRWVGVCQWCGRGRCMRQNYGQEPFAVSDEEIAAGEFEVPLVYRLLNIPYETW